MQRNVSTSQGHKTLYNNISVLIPPNLLRSDSALNSVCWTQSSSVV